MLKREITILENFSELLEMLKKELREDLYLVVENDG